MVRIEQVRGELLERFERIDRRVVQIEQRLGRIEQRIGEMHDRDVADRVETATLLRQIAGAVMLPVVAESGAAGDRYTRRGSP